MRKMMTLATLVFVAVAPQVLASENTAEADVTKIVQELADRTVAAIKVADPAESRRLLREAAKPVFDMKAIGEGVLAYSGARVPESRRAEVLDKVIAYIADKITGQIERVRPDKATIGTVSASGKGAATADMSLVGVRDSIDITWRLNKTPEGWRITDGEVSGVRMTMHFGEKLSRHAHGVDQLVDYLRHQQQQTASRL